MKKTIVNNLFNEVTRLFLVCSLILTLIVWIIQAVNFIDIISEDGHSIATYFSYAVLMIPKIYSKLLLLSFFVSLYYILGSYEDKKQLRISNLYRYPYRYRGVLSLKEYKEGVNIGIKLYNLMFC